MNSGERGIYIAAARMLIMRCPAFSRGHCNLTGCDNSCLQKGSIDDGLCFKYRIDTDEIAKVFASAKKKIRF